ncbi:MAG: hypothetical protein H7222_07560 [Methylotenera sp.]|nr:hypothetical protein [Oligoflexia bacterium]
MQFIRRITWTLNFRALLLIIAVPALSSGCSTGPRKPLPNGQPDPKQNYELSVELELPESKPVEGMLVLEKGEYKDLSLSDASMAIKVEKYGEEALYIHSKVYTFRGKRRRMIAEPELVVKFDKTAELSERDSRGILVYRLKVKAAVHKD